VQEISDSDAWTTLKNIISHEMTPKLSSKFTNYQTKKHVNSSSQYKSQNLKEIKAIPFIYDLKLQNNKWNNLWYSNHVPELL
jgi:hypothetical protein